MWSQLVNQLVVSWTYDYYTLEGAYNRIIWKMENNMSPKCAIESASEAHLRVILEAYEILEPAKMALGRGLR